MELPTATQEAGPRFKSKEIRFSGLSVSEWINV